MSAKQWGSLGYIDPEDALNGDAAETIQGQRNSMQSMFGRANIMQPSAGGGSGLGKWLLILGLLGGGYFIYTKYGKKGRR